VLGVIKLRATHPHLPRPYRTWGYPVTPFIFIVVTLFMMYYLLSERPFESLMSLLILCSGILIYAFFRNRTEAADVSDTSE
jgi:APA family basic amino acid/polyamine antiporter